METEQENPDIGWIASIGGRIRDGCDGADQSAVGAIMEINNIIRIAGNPVMADQSAPTGVQIHLFMCIIGPYARLQTIHTLLLRSSRCKLIPLEGSE